MVMVFFSPCNQVQIPLGVTCCTDRTCGARNLTKKTKTKKRKKKEKIKGYPQPLTSQTLLGLPGFQNATSATSIGMLTYEVVCFVPILLAAYQPSERPTGGVQGPPYPLIAWVNIEW